MREITSQPGQALALGGLVFRAYNKFGRFVLRDNAKFRTDIANTAENRRLRFLATRLRRNFQDTADDTNVPRFIIQHTDDAGLPAMDDQNQINAYHDSRVIRIYVENDQAGSAVSHIVFPDMSGAGLPTEGNVQYLLPLFFMVLKKIDIDQASQDEMLRAYFGTMLVSKCR
jgi:hypothetical protein